MAEYFGLGIGELPQEQLELDGDCASPWQELDIRNVAEPVFVHRVVEDSLVLDLLEVRGGIEEWHAQPHADRDMTLYRVTEVEYDSAQATDLMLRADVPPVFLLPAECRYFKVARHV